MTLNTVIIASQIIGAIPLGVALMKSGGFDVATMSMSELLQMLAMFRATDIDPMMDLISLVLAGAVFLGVWFGLGGKCLRAPLTPKGESTLYFMFSLVKSLPPTRHFSPSSLLFHGQRHWS